LRRFTLIVLLTVAALAAVDPDRAAFLEVHNTARAAAGAAPLQWSDNLAAYAQQWANELAKSGKFEHRPNNRYGENLATYSTNAPPEFAARLWLSEKKDYHGERIEARTFKKFGHYTQMVWATSTHVGYGVARTANGMTVVVANYDPPGNMQGERPYK
jgi:Cysteine-rich secretory protein family